MKKIAILFAMLLFIITAARSQVKYKVLYDSRSIDALPAIIDGGGAGFHVEDDDEQITIVFGYREEAKVLFKTPIKNYIDEKSSNLRYLALLTNGPKSAELRVFQLISEKVKKLVDVSFPASVGDVRSLMFDNPTNALYFSFDNYAGKVLCVKKAKPEEIKLPFPKSKFVSTTMFRKYIIMKDGEKKEYLINSDNYELAEVKSTGVIRSESRGRRGVVIGKDWYYNEETGAWVVFGDCGKYYFEDESVTQHFLIVNQDTEEVEKLSKTSDKYGEVPWKDGVAEATKTSWQDYFKDLAKENPKFQEAAIKVLSWDGIYLNKELTAKDVMDDDVDEADLYNSDLYKIYTFKVNDTLEEWTRNFREKYNLPNFNPQYYGFPVDNKLSAVIGDKYWIGCSSSSGEETYGIEEEKIFKEYGSRRIEASIKLQRGQKIFFGIFMGSQNLMVSPEGKMIAGTARKNESWSEVVNNGRERNIVVIETTKNWTKFILNGQLVKLINNKSWGGTKNIGFKVFGKGAAEVDYFMVSPVKDERYYEAWRKEKGLSTDPFMVTNFKGHSGEITDITVSPDEKEIVTCSKDKTIRIWDIKTGVNLRTFRTYIGAGDIGSYHCVAISPDNKYIAVGGYFSSPEGYQMGHIRFLDYRSGKVIRVLEGIDASITALEFSPKQIPEEKQMLMVAAANGKAFFYRYHHLVNNLDDPNQSPDFKAVELQIDKSYINSFIQNPAHDHCLYTMNAFKSTSYMDFKGSALGEGASDVEINTGNEVFSACYSADGEKIYAVNPSEIGIYDLKGAKLGTISAKNYPKEYKILALPDGEHILMQNKVYNIKTGAVKELNTSDVMPSHTYTVSPGGLFAYAGYLYNKNTGLNLAAPQQIGVIDLSSKKIIATFKSNAAPIEGIAFAPDSKGIILTKNYFGIDGKKEFSPKDMIGYFDFASLKMKDYTGNAISNNLIREFQGKKLKRWGMEGDTEDLGKLKYGSIAIKDKEIKYSSVVSYTLTPKGDVVYGSNFDLLIFDQKGERKSKLVGHSGGISALALSADGKMLLSLGQDNIINLWNLSDLKSVIFPIMSFAFSEDGDWICANNQKYYASSRYGTKYMGYVLNRGEFTEPFYLPINQFGIKYNRPDLILAELGVDNKPLQKALRRAWLKKLQNSGFEKSNKLEKPPFVVSIEPSQVLDRLLIDPDLEISRYNDCDYAYWQNDVRIYPTKIRNVAGREIETIDLVPGKNMLTAQPYTEKTPGYQKQVLYYADVPPKKPNLYIIAVGVSEYADKAMNLNFAAKDAKDITNEFSKSGYFNAVKTTYLSNTDATKAKILQAKQLLKDSKPWDVAVVYLAGHGLLSDKLDWYFGTHDIDFNNPEEKGLSYFEVENLFDSIPALNRLLLIDACHSGEVDKELVQEGTVQKISQNVGERGFKKIKQPQIGLYNSFELMQQLFGNLERGTGAVVISAAGGAEYAFEGANWKNGVFTYAVLEALKSGKADRNKNKKITVSELRNYVLDRVKLLTKGKQNPTSRKENLENDFRVW
jgi:WD40 repeat protein